MNQRSDIKPILGGLNTKSPPVMVEASQSPDSLNAIVRDRVVGKRGGLVPLFRDRMLGDCVENVAWRSTSRLVNTSGSADGDVVVSPGHLVAGHRSVYDSEPALTIALWFSPTSLIGRHSGNGENSGAAPYNPAPFTTRLLPIISKGPLKKSDVASGVAVADQWGTGSNAGMPFCVYLFNTGSGTAPVWEWRLSAHVKVAGSWTLQTVSNSEPVVEGARYHIIAAVSNTRVALRIARVKDGASVTYVEAQTTFTGQLASNKCPIQVFDCPQLFVQATAIGSATQRPGLGYTAAADGGYWFAKIRPEGKIDDISVWLGDRTLSTMDRLTKVAWTGQTDLINLWSFRGESLDYVKEETGRSNHLFLVPRGPVAVPDDGGKEGGSWFFNGVSSWALVDTFNKNWRVTRYVPQSTATTGTVSAVVGLTTTLTGPAGWTLNQWAGYIAFGVNSSGQSTRGLILSNTTSPSNQFTVESWTNGSPLNPSTINIALEVPEIAMMYALVRDNMAHGVAVEFWAESHEPAYLQVITEIHGVLKLAINSAGKIVGYCRDGAVVGRATTAAQIGETYQGPVTSTTTVVPGRRYHVALMRRDGGAALDLYVDGVLEASATGLNPASYATLPSLGNSHAPGAWTVGFGSIQPLIRAITPASDLMAPTWQANTDPTSGFIGRVETMRLLGSPNAATLVRRHGPENEDDWRFSEQRLWRNPHLSQRSVIGPSDPYDLSRNVGRGAVLVAATQYDNENGRAIAFPIYDTTSVVTAYGTYTLLESNRGAGIFGHTTVSKMGTRVNYVLAYYRFNVDDRDSEYGGNYVPGFERRYNGSSPLVGNQERHPKKASHLQESAVTDAVGTLGFVWKVCSEHDIIDDTTAMAFAANGYRTFRQRPYEVRSPVEIGPRWAPGLARPQLGTTPVTLVTDYDVQTAGRRLRVAACGRSLYWAKPTWDDGYLLFAGGRGSHVFAVTNPANDINVSGGATKSVIQFTCWVKPLRLDGVRMLACKRNLGAENVINWMVYCDNGSLTILGCEDTTAVWRFSEGSISGAPADVSRTTSLRVGVWNHVAVVIGPTTVTAWVNGQSIPLVNTNGLTGANQTNAWGTTNSILPTGEFYIGGSPDGMERIAVPLVTPTLTLNTESWFGYIRDVQVRTSVDSSRYSGSNGFPPPAGTADASSLYNWPLDEGDGSFLRNVAAATEAFDAEARILEFYPIASGLQQEDGRGYRSVVYRDSLIVTNGADNPQRITFSALDARVPWSVHRLGMSAPVVFDPEITATNTAGSSVTAGTYLVAVTFVNADGLESEPTLVGSYELASAVGTLRLHVLNLPRSHDPQVRRRRIYASKIGGGAALLNRDVLDNETLDVDIDVDLSTGVGVAEGNRLPAPRARHIAVAGASLVLADLPDEPAGQNAVAFSGTDEPSYFTTSSTFTIDSEDGKAIVGIAHNLGQVFFSKRDSIHSLSVGAIVTAVQVDASVRLVQPSDGIGGGTDGAGNLLYGAGDRGVFVFDNTNLRYLTEQIEPTWRDDVDRTDVGLYSQQGAFWRAHSQYWLSVRLKGDTTNTSVFVFDLTTQSWLRLDVAAHSWMGMLELRQGDSVPVFGTDDGKILRYDDSLLIDGVLTEAQASGTPVLSSSTGLSGSSTSLTKSGANWPTALAGLQGVTVSITHDGITETRRIVSNDNETIRWDDPLTGWTAHTSYSFGGYASYWTTPWMSSGHAATSQRMADCSIEMLPESGNLTVDVAAITADRAPEQAWPTGQSEQFLVPMLRGYSHRALHPRAHAVGTYHRIRFGTYGSLDPWGLIGFVPKLEPVNVTSQVGRSS